MNGVVCGAVIPHAPLLLAEAVGDEVAGETKALRRSIASLSFEEASVIVVLSPHSESSGVYGAIEGSLNDFSIEGVEVHRPGDRTAVNALSGLWGKPVLERQIDHGVLVPLKLLATTDKPIIAAGIRDRGSSGSRLDEVTKGPGESAPGAHLGLEGPGAGATLGAAPVSSDALGAEGTTDTLPATPEEDVMETEGPHAAIADGVSFAQALLRFAQDRRVAFVASAHTSSALLPRAPLTERADAKRVEEAALEALGTDPARLETRLMDLWARGGSCSVGSLAAYGEVFSGRASELLAYEYPFGVGYVVARVS